MKTDEYKSELMDDLRKEDSIIPETSEEEMMQMMEQDRRETIQDQVQDLMEQGIY